MKVAGVGSSIRNPSDKLPTIDRIILLKLIQRVAVEKMFSKNHNPIQKLIEIVRWKFIFADSEMKVNTNKSLIIIILIFNTGLILLAIQELSIFLLCENHLHSTTCRVFFNYRAVDVEDVKVLWQICLPDSLPGSLSLSTTLEKLGKIFSPHFAVLVRGIHFLMLCKFMQSKSWLIFFWIWECFRL